MIARGLGALAARAAARPRLVLALAAVIGAGAVVLALQLKPTAATSTFVSSSSGDYRATQRFYKNFGEEPVAVMVKGDLQQLVLSNDIDRLLGLEGCLSGKVPKQALAQIGGVNGPCGRLARAQTVKVVLGPGTFINEAARQINEQLSTQTKQAEEQAKAAEKVVTKAALARGLSAKRARELGRQAAKITLGRFQEGVATLALQYGLSARPSIDDTNFVSSLVFDSSKPAGTPKQRFAYLFPSRDAALVSVRLRAGLSESQRKNTIALIRRAVAMPQWHLNHGETYLVTGVPVIVADLLKAITRAIVVLMIAVALVMAATLALVFRARRPLLPLALALLATALTFAALSLVGASLTLAAVAVLPVLVGLAVDYAIQLQSRDSEELARLEPGAERDPRARAGAISAATAAGGPTVLTAAAASAGAMLALLLSPVPMVRGFGVLLIVGVALALLCALVVGAAAMAVPSRAPAPSGEPAGTGAAQPRGVRGARAAVVAAWRGARDIVADNGATRLLSHTALVVAVRRPGTVLGVGLALAVAGWGLDTQTRVETDLTKLVPQSLGSLRALNQLERTTGVAGEIDLMLSGRNVATPKAIEWMSSYQAAVLKRFGYSAQRGCGKARLCPAFSLPDLFSGGAAPTGKAPGKLTKREVAALLSAIPPYFSQDVITPDRRAATLAFGIRVMSLADQQRLIDTMRAQLHPPAGVHAELVGLPVLAARSGTQVADPWRRLLTLVVALAIVALVLLAAFRGDRRRALVPLAPIVLATGWSALVLFAVRVPLNPMSVTLGALVIAISTEFSVLLAERHRQERLAGHDTGEALRRTYRRTGAAVAASGVTAIFGFGVLVVSDIRMLRDFGLVTLIDLTVSLLGVLIALPAVLVLAERRESARARARSAQPRGAPPALGHEQP